MSVKKPACHYIYRQKSKMASDIMKTILSAVLLFTWIVSPCQQKITIRDFTEKGTFRQNSIAGINWMNDGNFYTTLRDNKIIQFKITTGEEQRVIFDGNTLEGQRKINDYAFSNDEKKLLLMTDRESIYRRSYTAEFYIYDTDKKRLTRLSENGRQAYATFSPDGSKVGFTRDNDLYYVTLDNMQEVRVTDTGEKRKVINGSSDWVYEEELSLTKAFFWSPDGEKLAFYTFDESHVKEYALQKWHEGALYPEDYRYKYPKAGERNSVVSIHIHDLGSGKTLTADTGGETDIYIPRIKWTKTKGLLSVIRLNRLQNKLEILHVEASSGKSTRAFAQLYTTYVDIDEADDLTYLNDEKHFIISGEKSGYKHLYLYTMTGQLVRQITNGDWEVKDFIGINEQSGGKTIYYVSTEISPLERHFYRIDLSGRKKTRLSSQEGINQVNMSNDFGYYLNYHHNATTPLNVNLFRTRGNKMIKTLEANQKLRETAAAYALSKKEFFTFKTSAGTELHGYMLKPINFDENKKYPVLLYQYSGPGSQSVTNGWGGGHFYWHQMLTQQGYIVAVVDSRGTGSRGVDFQKVTYKQLGKYETEDHIEAAQYLGNLKYIDQSRIGIWGWSYGGYISSLVLLKGAAYFKTAIAVAPVTSWRFYDTIYTERYLQKPQDNPAGYDDNSPITHAGKLKGNFLLIHGTADDNVHFQNAVVLQNALVAEGKQFQSFYYPDRAHGIRKGKSTRLHLYQMMTDFLLGNL